MAEEGARSVSMAEDVDRIADSDDIPGYEISDNNRSLENADHADEPSILPEEELSGGPAEPRFLINKTAFGRLVQEIMDNIKEKFSVDAEALEALQEASETLLVSLLADVDLTALHDNRVMIQAKDWDFIKQCGRYQGLL